MGENIPKDTPKEKENIQENTQDIQENIFEEENIPEEKEAVDSYDELAKGAELVEPQRGRGRPKGARNKPKPPPEPEESEEEAPMGPPPKRKKPKSQIAPLDVEFDEGYGGTGPPVRIKRPPAARSLMEVVAEATQEHGARERNRRRSFYESFLPI